MTDNSPAAIAVPDTGTYRIGPGQSAVHYSGRHLFGMEPCTGSSRSAMARSRWRAPSAYFTATVTSDAASFSSDNSRRDRDVRSAGLLDVKTYPEIAFRSEHVDDSNDGWTMKGTVTAHGHSVPVAVRVDQVTQDANGVRVHAWAEHLDRTAFGITGSRGLVGRYLDLELMAFAQPVS